MQTSSTLFSMCLQNQLLESYAQLLKTVQDWKKKTEQSETTLLLFPSNKSHVEIVNCTEGLAEIFMHDWIFIGQYMRLIHKS